MALLLTAPGVVQIANSLNVTIDPLDITTYQTATAKVIVVSGTISGGTISVSGTPTVSIVSHPATAPVALVALATVTGTVNVTGTATVVGTVAQSLDTHTLIEAAATTTVVCTKFARLNINARPAAAQQITIYNGIVAGGTIIARINVSTTGEPITQEYHVNVPAGSIQVVLPATMSVTVTSR